MSTTRKMEEISASPARRGAGGGAGEVGAADSLPGGDGAAGERVVTPGPAKGSRSQGKQKQQRTLLTSFFSGKSADSKDGGKAAKEQKKKKKKTLPPQIDSDDGSPLDTSAGKKAAGKKAAGKRKAGEESAPQGDQMNVDEEENVSMQDLDDDDESMDPQVQISPKGAKSKPKANKPKASSTAASKSTSSTKTKKKVVIGQTSIEKPKVPETYASRGFVDIAIRVGKTNTTKASAMKKLVAALEFLQKECDKKACILPYSQEDRNLMPIRNAASVPATQMKIKKHYIKFPTARPFSAIFDNNGRTLRGSAILAMDMDVREALEEAGGDLTELGVTITYKACQHLDTCVNDVLVGISNRIRSEVIKPIVNTRLKRLEQELQELDPDNWPRHKNWISFDIELVNPRAMAFEESKPGERRRDTSHRRIHGFVVRTEQKERLHDLLAVAKTRKLWAEELGETANTIVMPLNQNDEAFDPGMMERYVDIILRNGSFNLSTVAVSIPGLRNLDKEWKLTRCANQEPLVRTCRQLLMAQKDDEAKAPLFRCIAQNQNGAYSAFHTKVVLSTQRKARKYMACPAAQLYYFLLKLGVTKPEIKRFIRGTFDIEQQKLVSRSRFSKTKQMALIRDGAGEDTLAALSGPGVDPMLGLSDKEKRERLAIGDEQYLDFGQATPGAMEAFDAFSKTSLHANHEKDEESIASKDTLAKSIFSIGSGGSKVMEEDDEDDDKTEDEQSPGEDSEEEQAKHTSKSTAEGMDVEGKKGQAGEDSDEEFMDAQDGLEQQVQQKGEEIRALQVKLENIEQVERDIKEKIRLAQLRSKQLEEEDGEEGESEAEEDGSGKQSDPLDEDGNGYEDGGRPLGEEVDIEGDLEDDEDTDSSDSSYFKFENPECFRQAAWNCSGPSPTAMLMFLHTLAEEIYFGKVIGDCFDNVVADHPMFRTDETLLPFLEDEAGETLDEQYAFVTETIDDLIALNEHDEEDIAEYVAARRRNEAAMEQAAEESKEEERGLRGLVGIAAKELAQADEREEEEQDEDGGNELKGEEAEGMIGEDKLGELVDTEEDDDSFDLDLGGGENLLNESARDATSAGAQGDDDQNVARAAPESSTGQGGDGSLGLDPG